MQLGFILSSNKPDIENKGLRLTDFNKADSPNKAHSFGQLVGLILSKSILLMKQTYHQLFMIAFLQALIIRLAVVLFPLPDNIWVGNVSNLNNLNAGVLVNLIILAVLVLLVGTFGNAMMQSCFVAKVRNQSAKLSEISHFVFRKLGRLLLACFIYYFMMTLGMMLYFVPALILGALFFLYLPSLLFEEPMTAVGSLRRSWQLARGRFGLMLMFYILTSLLYLVPQLIVQELGLFSLSNAILNVLMIFAASFTLPLCNAICVTVYSYRRLEIAADAAEVVKVNSGV